ncbi:MAG: HNH endonuclease [Actinomycetota bacterium]
MDDAFDAQVRTAAFSFLGNLQQVHGDEIPRIELAKGFEFRGQRVPLVGPQGIFKPAVLAEIPISITTAPVVEGRDRPYDDVMHEGGLISYRYRGTDPQHHENVGLRKAMAGQIPLAYFHGVARSYYAAAFPAYIVKDEPTTLTFTVAVDEFLLDASEEPFVEDPTARRAYATRHVLQRLHQQAFRQRVISAYRESCAICRLRQRDLLDAAHILPDRDPRSEPIVSSGLSLCRLHHAAFDSNIVGIHPDYRVEIRRDVLEDVDGPMLIHGLQGFHGGPLSVPKQTELQPNRDFLAERYERFSQAS